jgi:hypothetical protein
MRAIPTCFDQIAFAIPDQLMFDVELEAGTRHVPVPSIFYRGAAIDHTIV